jgi:drug/metabolite transporter (DMT)-like permease
MALGSAVLIASAFLHALWNALLKRERSPQIAVAGVLSSAAVFAVAAALLSGRPAFATRAALGWGIAAGAFEGLYFVTLAAALARADYGIVYTVARGGAMLLVWPAGTLLLGEPIPAKAAAGACLIGIGLGLVAGRASRRGAQRAGVVLASACAISIAGYHLCYDRALALGAREAPLFAVALVVALPFVFASLRGRTTVTDAASARERRAIGLRWTLAGLLCTGSFLLFLRGLSAVGAAVALTLRNTSVAFAQGFALVLGERPTRAQLVGALLVTAGAVLVVGR